MYKIFLTIICLQLYCLGIAQERNFESGIIHLSDGTSQKGFIERNTFQKTGQSIRFQADATAVPKLFLPGQLNSFTYTKDGTTFQSVRFEFYQYNNGQKEKTGKAKRFAIELVTGAVDLLKVPILQTEYEKEVYGSKDFLYLLKKEDTYHQIDVLKTKFSGINEVVSKNYRGVLGYALNDCASIQNIVKKVEFSDKGLTSLLANYHQCIGQNDLYVKAKQSQPTIITQRVRAGYLFIRDDNFEDEIGFNAGYQLGILLPSMSRKIGISMGADIVYQSYLWNDFRFYRGDYKETDLRINIGFDLYLYNREQFKLTVTPGYNFFLMLNQEPKVTKKGVGNFQLFGLELAAQFKKVGVFVQTAGQGGNIARPDGMLNVGVFYEFK